VFARQLGPDALALAVVPRGRTGVELRASVIGRQGDGVDGLHVAFTVAGRRLGASSCGRGCYRALFAPARTPRWVNVAVRGRLARPWHVPLPAAWPPRDATQLLEGAGKTWRALQSLTFRESLGSGTGRVVVSTWHVQAPDRLAYQIDHGWAGVVIGARRWDRAPGAAEWQSSPQTRLRQPVPFWASVTDAHVLGSLTFAGRPAVRASFFDPKSPAWFTVVLDRKTRRTLDSQMVTNAHFMHDMYSAFNSTAPVVPPR
jgi:hypothetical protein